MPNDCAAPAAEDPSTALRLAREREAALREVLRVISESRNDEKPVFERILEKAAVLCGAPMASLNIASADRSHLRMVAHWGTPLQHLSTEETVWPMDSGLIPAMATRGCKVIQVGDLADTELYRQGDPVRVGVVD